MASNEDVRTILASVEPNQGLRRPFVSSVSTSGSGTFQAPPKTFTLSPLAKEFVPTSISIQPEPMMEYYPPVEMPRTSVQNRLSKKKFQTQPAQMQNGFSANSSAVVQTLEKFVQNLIRDPGLYNATLPTFMDFLTPCFDDPDEIIQIYDTARMLFFYSISNPNFRYNGARLCSAITENCSEFCSYMHVLCEKEILAAVNLTGLTLFTAELCVQMKGYADKVYASILYRGFNLLLEIGDYSSVMTVCQTLKLCGYKLDDDDKQKMDNLIDSLNSFKHLGNNVPLLIQSVINLRSNSWGMTNNANSGTDLTFENIESEDGFEENAIYYGPNGEEMTYEEYLEYSMDEIEEDDPDMDEMSAQYEEFLKLTEKS